MKRLNEAVTMDDLTADEEFITAAEFEDATRTVVRTLGRNFNLDILFAGNGAKTDGQTVYLPAQDPTKQMTKKQYAVGQGFANHETMHNLCSDMKFFTKELERLKGQGKKLAMTCANAIEDVRIERAAANLYPGIPSQISSTADYAAKMFLDEYLAKDPEIIKDFKRIGPLAVTWRGRQRMGYTAPYIDKCLAALEPEMLEKLDKWCDMIEKLDTGTNGVGDFDQKKSFNGSRDAVKYAELLAQEIEEIPPQEEENEDDSQPENGGKGGNKGNQQGKGGKSKDRGDSGGQGSGGGQDGDEGGGDGDDADGSGDQPDGQSDSNGGGAGGVAGGMTPEQQQANAAKAAGAEPDPIDPDMQAAVAKLLNEGEKSTSHWKPVTRALDVIVTKQTVRRSYSSVPYNNELTNPDGLIRYHQIFSEIGGKTAVMKRKFERALLTAAEAEYVSGQRTGRLDVRRRGVHIMQGKENIYRKKMDGKSVETAVSILVDASGSMSGMEMQLASKVCIALAECLERTSVDLEVLAFQARDPDDMVSKETQRSVNEIINSVRRDNSQASKYHRISPIMMHELKAFDESIREAKISLGNMQSITGGGTPDGDGILIAARRLMANKKPKKIMLVLTDGDSGYGHLTGSPTQFTKMAIDYCTKELGIHMIGVGIYTDHVQHLYKNWTSINDLDQLDKAVIDKIARLVLGENFRVDNGDLSGAARNFKRA